MIAVIAGLMLLFIILMPLPKFQPAFSHSVYAKDGSLLSAVTSSESQWCLPLHTDLPKPLITSILLYEDEYFYWHLGVNPVSIMKATLSNFKNKKIKRGASTIPMQVMRMKNRNASRTWINKIKEIFWATKYSIFNRKKTILKEWANMAPFGGNTIGVTAASLRYFGRNIDQLSWAEYALLTVLPNGPTSANLSVNRNVLKSKRDFLLQKLFLHGHFSKDDLEVFLDEDLPLTLKSVPQLAYHFLQFCKSQSPELFNFSSTINSTTQVKISELLENEGLYLRAEDIHNLAAVVIDISTNELVAYVGNIKDASGKFSYNDLVQASRSYGSLIKPLLYGYALDQNYFLPSELVADIPTSIGDFRPENFDKKYRGVVPFDEALRQSLNVPAVRILNDIGNPGFYDFIHKTLQVQGLDKGHQHYGLSIILGGGESTLWDLSRIYKGLARNYGSLNYPFDDVQYLVEKQRDNLHKTNFAFSPYAISNLTNTITNLTRPREEKSWEQYVGNQKIAWKTGTSFGHRDAWALGYSGKYMVGVWVGNETGEGRTDLTGITKAAPVLFKIFNNLPENKWFDLPPQINGSQIITVCRESGKLAGPLCKKIEKTRLNKTTYQFKTCNYHEVIFTSTKGLLLHTDCVDDLAVKDTLFKLPEYMEYFYIPAHPEYKVKPQEDPTCQQSNNALSIIYPNANLKIFLPKESEVKINQLIAKAYTTNNQSSIFWFLDDQFLKTTPAGEKIECLITASVGNHILMITDEKGNKDWVYFEVIDGDD